MLMNLLVIAWCHRWGMAPTCWLNSWSSSRITSSRCALVVRVTVKSSSKCLAGWIGLDWVRWLVEMVGWNLNGSHDGSWWLMALHDYIGKYAVGMLCSHHLRCLSMSNLGPPDGWSTEATICLAGPGGLRRGLMLHNHDVHGTASQLGQSHDCHDVGWEIGICRWFGYSHAEEL